MLMKVNYVYIMRTFCSSIKQTVRTFIHSHIVKCNFKRDKKRMQINS